MPLPSSSDDDPNHDGVPVAVPSIKASNHDSYGGNNSALDANDGDSDGSCAMKPPDIAARPLMVPSPASGSPAASPSASSSSSSSSSPPFSPPFLPAFWDRLSTCFPAPLNSEHLPVTRIESHPSHPSAPSRLSHPPHSSNHILPRLRITPTLFSNTLLLLLSLLILLPLLAIPLLAPPSPLPQPAAATQPTFEGPGAVFSDQFSCSETRSLEDVLTDLATSARMPPLVTSMPRASDVAAQGPRAAEAAADATSVSTNSSKASSTAGSSNAGKNGRLVERNETEAAKVTTEVAEEGELGRGVVIVTVLSEAWIPMMKMFLTRIRLVDEERDKHSQQQQEQQQQEEGYLRAWSSAALSTCTASLTHRCVRVAESPPVGADRHGHTGRMLQMRGTLVSRLLVICYDHLSLEFCCSLRLHCFLDTQDDAPKSERDDFSGGQKKFMTPSYLHLVDDVMWLQVDDVMWLQVGGSDVMWVAACSFIRHVNNNPLPHMLPVSSDMLIACDRWSEDPKEAAANGGFYMARSNDRVLRFFDYWLNAHTR
ncbi:unnamed protein product [Closterium sp. Naga37s-1]|nr:unnamed protein product [Closterium sp. Naga37s-1]